MFTAVAAAVTNDALANLLAAVLAAVNVYTLTRVLQPAFAH